MAPAGNMIGLGKIIPSNSHFAQR